MLIIVLSASACACAGCPSTSKPRICASAWGASGLLRSRFSPDQAVPSLSWMCSLRTVPKTIAASRPFPTGRACVHAPAGCRCQNLRAPPSCAWHKPEPNSSAHTEISIKYFSRISSSLRKASSVDRFTERDTRPVVGPKRHSGKSGAIVHRGGRKRLPGVTDRQRVRDRWRRDDYGIAFNPRVRPIPLTVRACHRELARLVTLHHQAAVGVIEVDFHGAAGHVFHGSERRS